MVQRMLKGFQQLHLHRGSNVTCLGKALELALIGQERGPRPPGADGDAEESPVAAESPDAMQFVSAGRAGGVLRTGPCVSSVGMASDAPVECPDSHHTSAVVIVTDHASPDVAVVFPQLCEVMPACEVGDVSLSCLPPPSKVARRVTTYVVGDTVDVWRRSQAKWFLDGRVVKISRRGSVDVQYGGNQEKMVCADAIGSELRLRTSHAACDEPVSEICCSRRLFLAQWEAGKG